MPRHSPTHDDMTFARGRGSPAMAQRFSDAVDAADLKARGIADQAGGLLAGLRGRSRSVLADARTWRVPGAGQRLVQALDRATRRTGAGVRRSPVRTALMAAAAGAAFMMLSRWTRGRGR